MLVEDLEIIGHHNFVDSNGRRLGVSTPVNKELPYTHGASYMVHHMVHRPGDSYIPRISGAPKVAEKKISAPICGCRSEDGRPAMILDRMEDLVIVLC
ncbi:hypothetical protein B9Z55_017174 [Caenorhabditis nigoni]|uniref:Uncharacterized protein n=1 Tax=Caenorhabditis nigoni TaxID=1611254 RepID=A0A2G5T8H5_9PELO|nr:hypothetical protein B9Z55_017174 [Caenorhabditis nigoni]